MRPPPTITSMSLTENYKENDGSNEKIKVNPVLKKTTCLASALMNESPRLYSRDASLLQFAHINKTYPEIVPDAIIAQVVIKKSSFDEEQQLRIAEDILIGNIQNQPDSTTLWFGWKY